MTIIKALAEGSTLVRRHKRIVFLAWCVTFLMGLLLALPMFFQLNGYIKETLKGEDLIKQLDDNWFRSYQIDFEKSEIARLLDYSVLGTGPFYHHMDAVLNGAVVNNVAGFFYDLIFRWSFRPSALDLLTLLAAAYGLLSIFLSAGFIGVYADGSSGTVSDFLLNGARYFGRFFRLALLSLIVYYIFFSLIVSYLSHAIPAWTQNSPSEQTPFVYYMVKNVVTLFVLAIVGMWFDYAKIRTVAEDRYSALIAMGAGIGFSVRRLFSTFGLYLLLAFVGVMLVFLFGWLDAMFPQTTGWTILLMFVLQQVYMMLRWWLKGLFFASQTKYFQESVRKEFTEALTSSTPA